MNADIRCPGVVHVAPPSVEVRYHTFHPFMWSMGLPLRSSNQVTWICPFDPPAIAGNRA